MRTAKQNCALGWTMSIAATFSAGLFFCGELAGCGRRALLGEGESRPSLYWPVRWRQRGCIRQRHSGQAPSCNCFLSSLFGRHSHGHSRCESRDILRFDRDGKTAYPGERRSRAGARQSQRPACVCASLTPPLRCGSGHGVDHSEGRFCSERQRRSPFRIREPETRSTVRGESNLQLLHA